MSTSRSGAAPSLGHRFEEWLVRVLPTETRTLIALVALTLALGLAIWQLPVWTPLTVLVLPWCWAACCSGRASCRGSWCSCCCSWRCWCRSSPTSTSASP